jgi:proteasome lid subunit RPN8/RPN11
LINPFVEAFEDAKAHARREFPKESCGLIVAGKYIACDNVSADPAAHVEDADCDCQLCSFQIDSRVYASYAKRVDMIVHSHPNGPFYPSRADMEGQLQTAKPWAIIALDDERVSGEPTIWGMPEPQPIIGRQFMHGVTDCYAVIQDMFALGRDKLAEQGIDWPFEPIKLMNMPRQDGWWEKDEDLYDANFEKAGFKEVYDPKPGDVFLMRIKSSKNNHAGVLVGENLIVHHLPTRLSRREPAGLWARQATRWLRYQPSINIDLDGASNA